MSFQPQEDLPPANSNSNTALFHQLDSYPWSSDPEFQGGLSAILGSVQDPQQIAHLTLRAKCYYYARKAGTAVDFDGYKAWVESGPDGNQDGDAGGSADDAGGDAGGGLMDAPKPASFAEICDLIAQGKPIPGIKEIPDTVLEGQKSTSQAERRRKPWEKNEDAGAEEAPSWMV
ncbi:uncharacterized protein K489DRAFT_316335 [Dissoconium aciculare CBS 342.82]|uniref:Uncharacterized protein n=1 Tax=Dissoconium aciculare CBS 342.82 TaxID=1314786 RepID=A0A6J3M9D4_9PEZI|nr:uncharacterized protein K489DRAFT_316335 [Dissoconium aciculare CBS 342.82]KAF1824630.1 hypothetical protein K489DRAFT_316335 [Dissoconium aciculare CBS 342.82]